MGGMFGKTQKQSQTTHTEPYSGEYKEWLYPVKEQVFSNFQNPSPAYTGQLNYGWTPTQQYGMQQFQNSANTPFIQDTISGKYLDLENNPQYQANLARITKDVNKQLGENSQAVNSQFAGRGLYDSSARRDALQKQANTAGDTMADMTSQLAANIWGQERDKQFSAYGAQQGALANLMNAAGQEQTTGQSDLDRDYGEQTRQWDQDYKNLLTAMQFMGMVQNPTTTGQSYTRYNPGVLGVLGK
jgi:hypothetical protein